MNRVERMYLLMEELQTAAPRPRTVPGLAYRLKVSERTVQRDLRALVAAGVPVRNAAGRGGGWSVAGGFALPSIELTGPEALALVVALVGADENAAFTGHARDVLRRITATLDSRRGGQR